MVDRAQLYQYKGNRCASCGMAIPEMVSRYGTFNRMFEFHHVNPSTKDRHYKRLMKQRLGRRQMDEIDKCVLLCTQCHAIIHAQEIPATLRLSAKLSDRLVRQQFEGWIKADKLDKSLTFVTNQPYLLEPCEVQIGSLPPRFMFLVEIEQETNLMLWLTQIEQHQAINIRSLRNPRLIMHIEHIAANHVRVTQSLGLPITTLEFYPSDQPNQALFFRNGFVLTASGELYSSGEINYNCTLTLPIGPYADA